MILETECQTPPVETSETKTIEVVVNGEPRRVPQGFHVVELLQFLGIDPAKVAVELNRSIVRKAEWGVTPVEAGAQIEVVWFVGGGSFPAPQAVSDDTLFAILERLKSAHDPDEIRDLTNELERVIFRKQVDL